jgi:hypothetical protein
MTDESQDDQIYRMRLLGNSPRAIADDFGISIHDVDAAVDEKMVKIDNAYRLRAAALDLERLEAMQARFLRDALSGDLAAGHLCLKIAERRAAMLGTDAPVRVDAVQLAEVTGPQPTSTVRIGALIDRIRSKRLTDKTQQDDLTQADLPTH